MQQVVKSFVMGMFIGVTGFNTTSTIFDTQRDILGPEQGERGVKGEPEYISPLSPWPSPRLTWGSGSSAMNEEKRHVFVTAQQASSVVLKGYTEYQMLGPMMRDMITTCLSLHNEKQDDGTCFRFSLLLTRKTIRTW